MDRQLQAQCNQSLLISNPSTAIDTYGELTYSASTAVKGRVVDKMIYMRGRDGESVMASKMIIFGSTVDVRINSRIYLPGETTSADIGWVPVGLALRVGESSSSDHWKVWLGGISGDGSAGR